MINSNVFDYINVMGQDGRCILDREMMFSANNIANVDTPRYKRQDINFEAQLRQALEKQHGMNRVDDKVSSLNDTEICRHVFILMRPNFSYQS